MEIEVQECFHLQVKSDKSPAVILVLRGQPGRSISVISGRRRKRLDFVGEDLRINRLHQEVIRPGLQGTEHTLAGAIRRDHDDWDVASFLILLQTAADLATINPGEMEIQQNELGVCLQDDFKGAFAIPREDDIKASPAQESARQIRSGGVVLDHHDLRVGDTL
jgi:hypothetical protein